ncbi:MAG: Asparagine synthetase [glutamine-hydrolyzing] 1 [Alphaproteobacteria bacterium MarineAlpha11_Bin1]|nr:MAG: Asparagine synthetase [glutamine-hydrolyzing] 1 [Alphaproteobacteria bacterium MarineAlpha11_Bin1]|tara:strand:- start:14925 stop:16634 length:1710 start_codon:yes stop_codon:yes gene_type:complete
MCGIFGGVGATQQEVRKSLELIRRGNDGITTREYRDVVLGARRHLVKQSRKPDVAPGESDQPYESEDGQIHLVFNGELYNFADLRDELQAAGITFSTEGDTEVFLRMYEAYGDAFCDGPRKFDSLFSLAVHDQSKNTLLITRDWPGRIPLFYFYDKDSRVFLFSSELKGFAAIDRISLADPVELVPGTMAILDLESFELSIRPVFSPQPVKTEHPLSEVSREFHLRLKRSAANRTMGDVPICTMLSGGIDSVMTSYYVLSSIDFDRVDFQPTSYVYAISDYESEDIRRAKNAAEGFEDIGLTLKEIRTSGDQLVEDLPDIIHTFEMRKIKALSVYPLPIYYYLGPVMHADGFKVTIGGHGVDELLGAYDAWKELKASHKAQVTLKSRLAFINSIYENMMRRASIIFMNRGPIEARFPFLETNVCEYALGIDRRWLSMSTENVEYLLSEMDKRSGPDADWTEQMHETHRYLSAYLDNNGAHPENADEETIHEMEKLFWKLPLIGAGIHASDESFLPIKVLFNPKLRGQHGSGITSLEDRVLERYRDLGTTDQEIFHQMAAKAFNIDAEAV